MSTETANMQIEETIVAPVAEPPAPVPPAPVAEEEELAAPVAKDPAPVAEEKEEEISATDKSPVGTESSEEASKGDGAGDEEEEEEEAGGRKGGKTKKPDASYPMPEDYEERKKASWKPEPLPDGTNIAAEMALIRLVAANQCCENIEACVRKYAATGTWPNTKLQSIFNLRRNLKDTYDHFKGIAEKQAKEAAEAKASRTEEKKAQLAALEAAMAKALMAGLKAAMAKDPLERMQAGVDAALAVFKEWAPKINSWPKPTIDKAVTIAAGSGSDEAVLRKILEESPIEETKPKEEGGKRKRDETPKESKESKESKGESSASGAKKPKAATWRCPKKADKGAKGSKGEIPSAMKQHMSPAAAATDTAA